MEELITNLEGLRILYVASKCLFYLLAFQTEEHDELVLSTDFWRSEEVLQHIADILIKHDSDYSALVDFFEKEADGDECVLGTCSQTEITKSQFAAQILYDMTHINEPIINKFGNLPKDF